MQNDAIYKTFKKTVLNKVLINLFQKAGEEEGITQDDLPRGGAKMAA